MDEHFGGGVNNLEAAVVGGGWANVESVMSLVGPGMSCAGLLWMIMGQLMRLRGNILKLNGLLECSQVDIGGG